jgi:hypothetical protein
VWGSGFFKLYHNTFMAEDFLTEFERALKERTNQLSPEERKLQSEQNLKKMAKNQTLSPEERRMKNRMDQLSPEEKKIQSKTNIDRIAKKQIDARNAKAQDYLDKSKARKMQSPAYRAGRASAEAQRTVVEGAKKFGSDLSKAVKSDIKVAKKAIEKVAPKVTGAVRGAGRMAVPIEAAIEAVRTARYLTDEDYRDVNQKAYEEMAEKPALARAVEGGLGGMATILTQAKNLLDTSGAYSRAAESRKAAEEGKQRLIAKGILDEKGRPTRLREAAPEAEESSKAAPQFDGEALSRALIEAPSVPSPETAPRTMEEATTGPATSEQVRSPMEQQMEAPKATAVIPEGRMEALFRKTTGTNFNPKSSADKGRMAELTAFIEQDPELLNKSDTKIALDFYRTLK